MTVTENVEWRVSGLPNVDTSNKVRYEVAQRIQKLDNFVQPSYHVF